MTEHASGTFCWTQLGTNDPKSAKKFYSSLFGWTTDETSADGVNVTLLKRNGREVGALYAQPKSVAATGVDTPSWLPFIAVDSADETTEKVRRAGGKVLMEPGDVLDNGRQAMLQDPTGAVFAVWQARKMIGAGIMREVGSMVWQELITTDATKASTFYRQVFGWTEDHMPTLPKLGGKYTVFQHDGTGFAGMLKARPEMHLTHPYWLTYFAVDNCDQSAAKAEQLGGKVQMQPTDIPDVGRFAVLTDPQGGWFAILQPKPRSMK